jgi:hypothetical protein
MVGLETALTCTTTDVRTTPPTAVVGAEGGADATGGCEAAVVGIGVPLVRLDFVTWVVEPVDLFETVSASTR